MTTYEEWTKALDEFMREASFPKGSLIVIGCSTSEVGGQGIGSSGSEGVAAALFSHLQSWASAHKLSLAFQCCEHLNRAVVVEEAEAVKRGLDTVWVVPVANAGGAMASYAYQKLHKPVVVEEIKADGGIDIGHTLIGMHLKQVAVPVRVSVSHIGKAPLVLAKTRPKRIGGERAVYHFETKEDE
ncbi:TIGR01440 family protein [Bacillaceae bacterium SIJ1]|uniref:TIGR01440 family protein n=1 Tax=Litoribacterium kuwaitense TaxID=1398745 RepID=UPI0013EB8681|nr:TIGR01440 family protein [Litoribacterium kuwaitense]NGP44726.1 TIGR01440 family protein [Litoribacterium kuwaitense]